MTSSTLMTFPSSRKSTAGPFAAAHVRIVLVAAVLSLAAPGVSADPLVSAPIAVWTDAVPNESPVVAYSPAHEEFLVVWQNVRAASVDLYARRVGLDGSLRSDFTIHSTSNEYHVNPAVAYSSTQDAYLVVWEDSDPVSGDIDVLARLVNWDGSSMGPVFDVVNEIDFQQRPRVAYNEIADEFLVAWGNVWIGGTVDIACQRISGGGTLLNSLTIASGPTTNHRRYYPSLTFQPATDQYLVVYKVEDPGVPGVISVRARLVDADLSNLGPEILVFEDPAAIGDNPDVTAGPDGYLVVYFQTPEWRTFARRLDPGGTPLGSASGFPVAEIPSTSANVPSHQQTVSWVAPLGYLVTWYEATGSTWDVRARFVASGYDGYQSAPFAIDIDPAYSAYEPVPACAPHGTCLVGYQSTEDIAVRLVRPVILTDSFESGNTSMWSSTIP